MAKQEAWLSRISPRSVVHLVASNIARCGAESVLWMGPAVGAIRCHHCEMRRVRMTKRGPVTETGPGTLAWMEASRDDWLDKAIERQERIATLEAALAQVRAYVPTPEEAVRLSPLAFSARLALVGVVVDGVLATRAGAEG